MPRKFLTIYISLIYFQSVTLLPISVHSESSLLDDKAQHKDTNAFRESAEKGNAGGRYAAGFSEQQEQKHQNAQDSGSYNNVNNDRNSYQDNKQYFGENAHRQNAGTASQFGRQGGHRKGHRKSGHQNSYHKEESENNSSFYDDSDDQGGHFVYNGQNGGFSSAGADRNQGSHTDGHLYAKGNGQKGSYDVGGNYDKVQADKNGYNQKGYYDNNRNQGRSSASNGQGVAGRHVDSQIYNQQPQYYNNYNKYEPRRTITIYEDPRDFYSGPGYNKFENYDEGLIQLNFRPNPYLNYPQNFDGYYY